MSVTGRRVPRETAERAPTPAAESCAMVIFGATGDLTQRKLISAVYSLRCCDQAAPMNAAERMLEDHLYLRLAEGAWVGGDFKATVTEGAAPCRPSRVSGRCCASRVRLQA